MHGGGHRQVDVPLRGGVQRVRQLRQLGACNCHRTDSLFSCACQFQCEHSAKVAVKTSSTATRRRWPPGVDPFQCPGGVHMLALRSIGCPGFSHADSPWYGTPSKTSSARRLNQGPYFGCRHRCEAVSRCASPIACHFSVNGMYRKRGPSQEGHEKRQTPRGGRCQTCTRDRQPASRHASRRSCHLRQPLQRHVAAAAAQLRRLPVPVVAPAADPAQTGETIASNAELWVSTPLPIICGSAFDDADT